MILSQPEPSKHQDRIKELRVAIVSAGLSHLGEQEAKHSKLVRASVDGARDELLKLGYASDNIIEVEVPGALEIPLMCKRLIAEQELDGVIGCALIVNGEIYRHEFVAQASLYKLMEVSLEMNTPIASCMLTPSAPKSPETQFDMLQEHLRGKGEENAGALTRQILQLRAIDQIENE